MGIETGTAMLIGAIVSAASAAVSVMSTPQMPKMDTTDYDMLRRTREKADVEAAESQARIDEARKREELRQQQALAGSVLTSDEGAESLDIRQQVLGVTEDTGATP